jgi:hypothetical protein
MEALCEVFFSEKYKSLNGQGFYLKGYSNLLLSPTTNRHLATHFASGHIALVYNKKRRPDYSGRRHHCS